ncbi:DUF4861 family protein [Flavobacterium sp. 3HN19-14]|uniref:DUF4861 family protein n=1 Tax=Flavobacterium sp. 3HN19-14 TaxID=3448133 RepID=UPI003EE2FC49
MPDYKRRIFLWLSFLFFCESHAQHTLIVRNPLDFLREEIVSIPRKDLDLILSKDPKPKLQIKRPKMEPIRYQWVDLDADGVADELLFLARVHRNGRATYTISEVGYSSSMREIDSAYSRFVPERSDDYAWKIIRLRSGLTERKGQEEALKGIAGSTLSSGIDIWLKRTNLPVINKWYGNNLKTPGYYHKDHGEGYDPFHVGASRGVGGTGIWVNDSLQVSQNFVSYKTISSGPLRTIFELTYAPWSEFGVVETKRISLDFDSNFSKIEVDYSFEKAIPNFTIGLTTHENKGISRLESQNGWIRYWEKIDDAFVGTGIVIQPDFIDSAFAKVTQVSDQSNIFILAKPSGKVVYYAGFVWQKSNQVKEVEDWDAMLERQAEIIAHPLTLEIK